MAISDSTARAEGAQYQAIDQLNLALSTYLGFGPQPWRRPSGRSRCVQNFSLFAPNPTLQCAEMAGHCVSKYNNDGPFNEFIEVHIDPLLEMLFKSFKYLLSADVKVPRQIRKVTY